MAIFNSFVKLPEGSGRYIGNIMGETHDFDWALRNSYVSIPDGNVGKPMVNNPRKHKHTHGWDSKINMFTGRLMIRRPTVQYILHHPECASILLNPSNISNTSFAAPERALHTSRMNEPLDFLGMFVCCCLFPFYPWS